jgi:hypothetical protein
MSNGTQTVVRETFHRIGVTEKSSERCLGTYNFLMSPGYGLDGARVRFCLRVRSFTSPAATNAASYAMATGMGTVYPGIKRPKNEADLPPPNVNA